MPLVVERQHVLDIYAEAREKRWVIPCFNAENLTTMEATLAAAMSHGQARGVRDLPITIGITNTYASRPQARLFTNTNQWAVGLRLFLKNLEVLTSSDSPYGRLKVMVHLDHIQWDQDKDLLDWDMRQFSSIMYDASTLDLDHNMRRTAAFVEEHGSEVVIEGACDEISSATGDDDFGPTKPDDAEQYFRRTGVDIIVANLGTEHRSPTASLRYESALAREITRRVGPRLCLHGASSLDESAMANFHADGICKVNIWTALERDSTPALFRAMVENAARLVGAEQAREMREAGLLGNNADTDSARSIEYYTTTFRRGIIFGQMKSTVGKYLGMLMA